MKKKLTDRLFTKVFFLTFSLLLCTCMLVYGLLAWLMPQTYSDRLNASLDAQAHSLILELEQVSFSDSGGLFTQFLQNPEISHLELYTDNGSQISLPQTYADASGTVMEQTQNSAFAVSEDTCDTLQQEPVLTNSYYFSFADDSTRYLLIVYGTAEQIAQLQHTFVRILPLLFLLCLTAALFTALLYAHILTKPVLRLCHISKKMSDLQFDWHPEHARRDELGILEKNLHELSGRLAGALTELKTANDRLTEDIAHEKALEQARTDFFSAISHELKTPVTVIKGQLEGMLLDIGAYKNHKKYLAKSLETAGTLEHMVQEIVTISRLEAANTHFPMQRFACAPLIRSYLNTIEDLITKKELELSCELAPDAFIYANKLLMEKVFSNLIGNAIQYAPPHADIHIRLTTEYDHVRFSVENSGTHLPEECIPGLFDAFYRVDQSRSRKTGGSGLGLYLVRKILAQHQSQCIACNTPDGVRFSFIMRGQADDMLQL